MSVFAQLCHYVRQTFNSSLSGCVGALFTQMFKIKVNAIGARVQKNL